MTRSLLRPAGLGQLLLLWLLLSPVPMPRTEARRAWPSLLCPAACEPMRCPPLPTCTAGAPPVLDRCRCCRVCAAAEGQACGEALRRPCAPGLQCGAPFGPRRPGGARLGTCGCPEAGAAVCGSDGRTYPSLCALRAENRAARRRGALPAVPVQSGGCEDPGERRGRALPGDPWNFLKERSFHGAARPGLHWCRGVHSLSPIVFPLSVPLYRFPGGWADGSGSLKAYPYGTAWNARGVGGWGESRRGRGGRERGRGESEESEIGPPRPLARKGPAAPRSRAFLPRAPGRRLAQEQVQLHRRGGGEGGAIRGSPAAAPQVRRAGGRPLLGPPSEGLPGPHASALQASIAALKRPSDLFRVVEEERTPTSKSGGLLHTWRVGSWGFLSPSSPSDTVEGQRQELGSTWR